jgi:ubiquinone/menaquinone biosynthesis C-methylase UbiE
MRSATEKYLNSSSLKERVTCALTGAGDLELLDTFVRFPVFMGCTNAPESDDLYCDMQWMISRRSGLIQLGRLLPMELLYPEAHGSGATGAIWSQHHQAFAKFIHQFGPSSVLEIGGGHGVLAKQYQEIASIPWVIVEPNPTPIPGCAAQIIKGFFDASCTFESSFDVVAHSHVLEHIYDPHEFMINLARVVDESGVLCFSLPNMKKLLEQKSSSCLNFEHTLYLTEPYIDFLLDRHGFTVVKKDYFQNNHSIFYAAQKTPDAGNYSLSSELYNQNRATFTDFARSYREVVIELNQKIADSKNEVYLFGAHVFSQILVAFGLNIESVVCVLDNDSNKWERRLYGTSLDVTSPEILRNKKAPKVILKAGPYNQEIRNGILQKINPTTVFWE